MNIQRIWAIVNKETMELRRDRMYLGLAFAVPLIQLFLFGYGMSLDVKHLKLAYLDHDRSSYSRDYLYSFINSEYFDLVAMPTRQRNADDMIRAGQARVVLEIPPDFGRRVAGGLPVVVRVYVDGSFPSRAEVSRGYVLAINNLYNDTLRENHPEWQLPIKTFFSYWYNPSLESENAIVPGMIVLNLMMFPALLGALLLVREKESGTIFNYYSSPVGRMELILGKAIPYVGVALVEFLLMYAMGQFLFHARFVGSFGVLFVGVVLYCACTIGIGLFISVITNSQLAAMLVVFLATVTPAFNFSGFTSPVSSQDAVGQFISKLIPASYFMEIVRGCYLKGLGFGFYRPQFLSLAVYTIVVYCMAWLLLKKRIA